MFHIILGLIFFHNSFFPYAVRVWNLLSSEQRNIDNTETFKVEISKNDPKPKVVYSLGERKAGVIHARIRMKCSLLKAHLFAMHVSNDTICECGHTYEDEFHYFFTCHLYQRQRALLHAKIIEHASFTLYTLLHGSPSATVDVNKIIGSAVHTYIEIVSRFS